MADYVNITTAAESNFAGIRRVLYFAPLNSFLSIGAAPAVPATLAEANVIAVDHTFTAPAGFFSLELEMNKNDLNGEYIGDVMGGAQAIKLTGFSTGLGDKQLALFEKLTREKHIFLVPLLDGKIIQLGEEGLGVMVKTSVQIGTEGEGERGTKIEITHYGRWLRYDGTITKAVVV